MKRLVFAGFAVLLGLCVGAQAIDRDARMIDTFSLNLADQDDIDSIGASLWGEAAFVPSTDWAILFGIDYAEVSPDFEHNIESWGLGIGLKYYILPVTSISGVGTYTRYDLETEDAQDKDAKAAIVTLKQRLISADAPVCPFLKGSLTWRNRSTFSEAEPQPEEDSYSEVLLTLGGGAEFEMRKDFTFVFDAGYIIADESSDSNEDLDGFAISIGMQYYWGPYVARPFD